MHQLMNLRASECGSIAAAAAQCAFCAQIIVAHAQVFPDDPAGVVTCWLDLSMQAVVSSISQTSPDLAVKLDPSSCLTTLRMRCCITCKHF